MGHPSVVRHHGEVDTLKVYSTKRREMTEKATKPVWNDAEKVLTLLAESNRWDRYIGNLRDTRTIDRLIVDGETDKAIGVLLQLHHPDLSEHLAKQAISARKKHLLIEFLQAAIDQKV